MPWRDSEGLDHKEVKAQEGIAFSMSIKRVDSEALIFVRKKALETVKDVSLRRS